ncbi:MAG TPA: hypothetical protein VI248_01260 [Kineosporiaceae bacterium]
MTAPIVPAVIPSPLASALVVPTSGTVPPSWTVPVPGLRRTPLPLVELPELGDPAGGPGGRLVCGVATMDCNGRLADATVIGVLGWGVGARLDLRVRANALKIRAIAPGMCVLRAWR